jgi:hypothetical protein
VVKFHPVRSGSKHNWKRLGPLVYCSKELRSPVILLLLPERVARPASQSVLVSWASEWSAGNLLVETLGGLSTGHSAHAWFEG